MNNYIILVKYESKLIKMGSQYTIKQIWNKIKTKTLGIGVGRIRTTHL